MLGLFGRSRRRRIRARPLRPEWTAFLTRNLPVYSRLSASDRKRLHGLMQVFLSEKHFEGAGGLVMTDEIRVTIAAQACLLLIGQNPERAYPGLKTIIVYPSSYVATSRSVGPAGVVTESTAHRAGESWNHLNGAGGPVVLAWDEVVRGGCDADDGSNVVYHEFAHQLDGLATGMDGAPALGSRTRYAAWARVLGAEFESLRRDLSGGRETVLRAYGATNPAEFFGVATEAYFERPSELRRQHPELFEELARFYAWTAPLT